MAGSSLLALIDDISAVLDDVASMTKVAARKTAGVLGDDLALNAQQVTGVRADRELPVVWAVAKGSLLNKAILVPAALLISAVAPWLVVPLLMFGGLFLCYEGAEKLLHKLLHRHEDDGKQARLEALADPDIDLVAFERDKIRGAVRTDFILSAEIIAITLGTVASASFVNQLAVLSTIALVITLGVYGLVAGIVKLDDAGLYLSQRSSAFAQSLGRGLLALAPWLMKTLSVVGTAAMFMVGGGILSHGLPPVEAALHHAAEWAAQDVGLLSALLPTLFNALLGIVAGLLSVPLVGIGARLWRALRPSTAA
jgi:predicted DNA repair protein MutK